MKAPEKYVGRLKKIGLSDPAARHLAASGISSVMQLAMLPKHKLEELLGGIDTGRNSVQDIHKKAKTLKAMVDNYVVTVRGQVSPYFKALASTNPDNRIINFHEGMESYDEMFGSLEYAACAEFDSMLGPAAYLVDLMRYIDEYIAQPAAEALQLKTRRPDIWNVPLTNEATVTEVPYLQLVNEVLIKKLQADQKVNNPVLYMAENAYPFQLPFNAPLEKIRKYLEALKTELYEVYRTFRLDEPAQRREYLKLSPEQFNFYTTPLAGIADLNIAYGYIETDNPNPHFTGIQSAQNLGGLDNAVIFTNQAGFTRAGKLEELFYQNNSASDKNTQAALLELLFINRNSGTTTPIAIEETDQDQKKVWLVNNLNLANLDTLNRFIRLADHLGWTYEDLDWALTCCQAPDITADTISMLSGLQRITDRLKIGIKQACSLWTDLKTTGAGAARPSQALFDQIFNEPTLFYVDPTSDKPTYYHPQYDRNPTYTDKPLPWHPFNPDEEESQKITARLLAALNLDATNLKDLVLFTTGPAGPGFETIELQLTVANLSKMYRYALLANGLSLSISDMITLFGLIGFSLEPDVAPKLGNQPSLPREIMARVEKIMDLNAWLKHNRLSLSQLAYISNGVWSRDVDPGFDLAAVPDLLAGISSASVGWYLKENQLQAAALIDAQLASTIFNTLKKIKRLDGRGILLKSNFSFEDVSALFACGLEPYSGDPFVSIFGSGKPDPKEPASMLSIPLPPSTAQPDAFSIWFRVGDQDAVAEAGYTLTAILDEQQNPVLSVKFEKGQIYINNQSANPHSSGPIPADGGWHFMVLSLREKLATLDGQPLSNLPALPPAIPSPGSMTSGSGSDSSWAQVAELRLFDEKISVQDINTSLYSKRHNPVGSIPGNSNYWPLNEGEGASTAGDAVGNWNGAYQGAPSWSIGYNVDVPKDHPYLNGNQNLKAAFDPNDKNNQPFLNLWKAIVSLRNALNSQATVQKAGLMQKLADFYQYKEDLTLYANYAGFGDQYAESIQTILSFRFSLNPSEFALEFSLDPGRKNTPPFISDNLRSRFQGLGISLPQDAKLERVNPAGAEPVPPQWMIISPDNRYYFVAQRGQAGLDVYSLSSDGDLVPIAPAIEPNGVISSINTLVAGLGKLLFTVKTLQVSQKEFQVLISCPDRFFQGKDGKTQVLCFSVEQIKSIVFFKRLNRQYTGQDSSFADYFSRPDDLDSLKYAASLTGWDYQQLQQLSTYSFPVAPADHNIQWFEFASDCFSLSYRIGVSISFLLNFLQLSKIVIASLPPGLDRTEPPYSAMADDNQAAFAEYTAYAAKLENALKLHFSDEAWNSIYAPLQARFLSGERDALAAYMLWYLQAVFSDIDSLDDLYELLLIDVASSGCRSISPVKAALNSLQLYIERCRMQLEPGASIDPAAADAADTEWSWMSHYRIWEANREVFLYPENYYDPTLRKDQTAAYADLQNNLSQSNLTNDIALASFQTYFDDLEAMANLQIVSICLALTTNVVNGNIIVKDTFFIFGKLRHSNGNYYYRTATAIGPLDPPDNWNDWSNWQKLNINIKAESLVSTFASQRPYVFWLEFTKQQVTGTGTTYDDSKSFQYQTRIYYSFQNAGGKWTTAHILPDLEQQLDFTLVQTPPAHTTFYFNLPDAPQINVLCTFLEIADLAITVSTNGIVNGNQVNGIVTFTLPVDNILNLQERNIWFLNGQADAARAGNGSALTASNINYQPGTFVFQNRKVAQASQTPGMLTFDTQFNPWFGKSFTFGIWINISEGMVGGTSYLFSQDADTNYLYIKIADDQTLRIGSGSSEVKGQTAINPGEWYFLAFRYNTRAQEASIFVNGLYDNAPNQTGTVAPTQSAAGFQMGPLIVGAQLADVFVIQTALTDAGILSIFEEYVNQVSDVVENHFWALDQTYADIKGKNPLAPSPQGATLSTFINPPNPAPPGSVPGRQILGLTRAQKGSVQLPLNFNTALNSDFSIGISVFPNANTLDNWPVLSSSDHAFLLSVINGKLQLTVNETVVTAGGTIGVSPGIWTLLALTNDVNTQNLTVYVYSAAGRNKYVFAGVPYLGSAPFSLGVSGDDYADGFMRDFILVEKALTEQEIGIYYSWLNIAHTPDPAANLTMLQAIQATNAKIIQQYNQDLFVGGSDFLYGNNSLLINRSQLSSDAPYGKYIWELFYHIPMLMGQLLNANQKFEQAKHWYEYIFNPISSDTTPDRFWELGYFRSLGRPEDLVAILTDGTQNDRDQILTYDLDPFDPEAIAYLRPGAFEKKTVMRYIRNLLDWGDSLFSQYTWETITEAEMLYVLAKELLGARPQLTGSFSKKTAKTFSDVEFVYGENIPQFIIDLEDKMIGIHDRLQARPALSASLSNFYFCIPENAELPLNYDLVDTRLYEIRHCLNISGQKQALALFQPPINPMLLVAAGAQGISFSNIPISLSIDVPYYRYETMIQFAKNVAQRVVDFGQGILAALEKNDAEALARLQAVQERSMLDLTTSIREQEIQQIINQAQVIETSRQNAEARVNYYGALLATPVSALEALSMSLSLEAIAMEVSIPVIQELAGIGHLIPTVYGFADGDFQPGSAIEAEARMLNSIVSALNNTAQLTATTASYIRRAQEWGLQQKLAEFEVTSAQLQQDINTISLNNAQTTLNIQNQSIANNQNLQNFYADKFTNQELYQWMIGQISVVYYQTYKIAFDLAKKAEAAYQFEMNTDTSIINYGYWDTTRKGLVAGEKLLGDLERLDKAYVDNNVRYLEIQKIVSLKMLDPVALFNLITTGACVFDLNEQQYDYDFPGHYNRKIKTVSIAIPAVVGPYQTIKATLKQQSNWVVTQPSIDAVKYLVSPGARTLPPGAALRVNWRPNEQIAISRAVRDSGLFDLNFNDSRYLPFEGTGAVSSWELKIPRKTNQFDLKTISDIILTINYTAQDGGDDFRQRVSNLPEISLFSGSMAVSLKQQFNREWNTFLQTQKAGFPMDKLIYTGNLDASTARINSDGQNQITLVLIAQNPGSDLSELTLNGNLFNAPYIDVGSGYNLSGANTLWELAAKTVAKDQVYDIVFIIPYSAQHEKSA